MANPTKFKAIVSFDLPEGVSQTDARDYVRDAVSSWSGQFEPPHAYDTDSPGDPRWHMGKDVKITFIK